ncbi:hypothetical protein DSO57_1039785 [Entomophthora muscae]|uniref:Uncharacterized protein n=1 Tax=Entomophthora muscae TaxID=34485 RepID=A0ACC2S7F7_9FUNG|nr:hypothetical protein DSO57_1039785 [Entomophthora muscae]
MYWDRIRNFNILGLNFILKPLSARLPSSARYRPAWPAARADLESYLVRLLRCLAMCSWFAAASTWLCVPGPPPPPPGYVFLVRRLLRLVVCSWSALALFVWSPTGQVIITDNFKRDFGVLRVMESKRFLVLLVSCQVVVSVLCFVCPCASVSCVSVSTSGVCFMFECFCAFHSRVFLFPVYSSFSCVSDLSLCFILVCSVSSLNLISKWLRSFKRRL